MKTRSWIVLFALTMQFAPAQSDESDAKSFAWMGGEMLRGTASLVETALSTRFFLDLADQFDLTQDQRDQLSEIDYRSRSNSIEKIAEIQLAASEIRFLLSRPEINLTAVEATVSKMHGLRADLQTSRIRAALEAIGKIGHAQHRLAITAEETSAKP